MPVSKSDQPAALTLRKKATRNYKFYLYESNLFNTDLHPITGLATPGLHTAVADLTTSARDKKFDPVLNKPGTASFRLPLNSVAASLVFGFEIRRSIVIYIDNAAGVSTPYWAGVIWNTEATTENNSLSVSVVGNFEFLNHREIRNTCTFPSIDAGVIATRLLSTANTQIANDNTVVTGAFNVGTSAEDLLFGAGDFESPGTFTTTGGALDTNFPAISTAWSVSGSSSVSFSSTNRNSSGYIQVVPPRPNSNLISNFNMVPIDAGSTYQVRWWANLTTASGTNTCRSVINWYTAAGALVSQTVASAIGNTLGAREIVDAHVAPATSFYAVAFIEITTGTTGTLIGFADAMVMSKTSVLTRVTPITIGTVSSPANPAGANRTRTYQVGQKIGPAIEELSQIEAGFDFEVALVPTTVNGGATLLRQLNIYYNTVKGTIKGLGSDKVDVLFAHRFGPNNLRSVRESHDSSKLANRINGRAPGKSARVHDLTSISLRNMFEDTVNISDANTADNVVLYYAGAELAFRLAPFKIYNISPFPWDGDSTSARIPRYLIDYIIGDVVYLVANNGAMQIGMGGTAQPIRIFGLSISIDMEGNERVESLQTAAS